MIFLTKHESNLIAHGFCSLPLSLSPSLSLPLPLSLSLSLSPLEWWTQFENLLKFCGDNFFLHLRGINVYGGVKNMWGVIFITEFHHFISLEMNQPTEK